MVHKDTKVSLHQSVPDLNLMVTFQLSLFVSVLHLSRSGKVRIGATTLDSLRIKSKINQLLGIKSLPDTPILVYHNVDERKDNPLIADNIHSVTAEVFHAQLSQLKKEYTVLFVDELVERMNKKQSISKLAAVTFDDGYQSVSEIAYPILYDLEVPATLYVAGNIVQNKTFWRDKVRYIVNNKLESDVLRYFNKQEVAYDEISSSDFYKSSKSPTVDSSLISRMIDGYLVAHAIQIDQLTNDLYLTPEAIQKQYDYLRFGNHTFNHYLLSSLSREEQRKDIEQGHQFLANLGVETSSVFSIPFGGMAAFNKDTIDILQELGYSGYLTCSNAAIASGLDMEQPYKASGMHGLTRFLPGPSPIF